MVLPTAERDRCIRSAASAKLPASAALTKAAMPLRRSLIEVLHVGAMRRDWCQKLYKLANIIHHCSDLRGRRLFLIDNEQAGADMRTMSKWVLRDHGVQHLKLEETAVPTAGIGEI